MAWPKGRKKDPLERARAGLKRRIARKNLDRLRSGEFRLALPSDLKPVRRREGRRKD